MKHIQVVAAIVIHKIEELMPRSIKLKWLLLIFITLVLPNQQTSYADLLDLKKHIAIQLDEDSNQLTITNITKQNVYDQERLKLNKLDLENRWAFFINSIPEEWCRDYPMSGIGYVRVVVDTRKSSQSSDSKTGDLPINLTLIVRDKIVVDRWMGIDPSFNKPLNKIVIKGDEIKVELYHGGDQPEIYSPPPPVSSKNNNNNFGGKTLLWRPSDTRIARQCSDRTWTATSFGYYDFKYKKD